MNKPSLHSTSTIAAPATAIGRAGIGIIRLSGPKVRDIASKLLGELPQPRYAHYAEFKDQDSQIIDKGLALFFPAPHSFTGEDVLELHGHGGVVVMDLVLKRILSLGATIAKPGEFSERAFLNDKIDLTQAEAIADLIDAGSEEAARAAMQSLQGVFSQHINRLLNKIITLRMYIEAALDFPEEDIDFIDKGQAKEELSAILDELSQIQKQAKQGVILREGMSVVIAGAPNVGKSSLLNQLCDRDSAIVTAIPGTTRDLLREHIQIDGLPLQIIDTAGLRESDDPIEQEGIRRAHEVIEHADCVLYVTDVTLPLTNVHPELLQHPRLTLVHNKIDLINEAPGIIRQEGKPIVRLSAKTGMGIDLLKQHLKTLMGFSVSVETGFSARRRHFNALNHVQENVQHAMQQLTDHRSVELVAEDLRLAQQCLSEITGEFTSDDLLGMIFQNFCIGK
jgi:tRNA modification GTPase